jgi:hypothetical protein
MANQPQKYETQQVKTVRGFEAKKISEMEKDGWELVEQESGKVRTTLSFRRAKKPFSIKSVIGIAAATIVIVSVIVVGTLNESKDAPEQESASPAPTQVQPEQTPGEPTQESEQPLTVETNEDLAILLSNSNNNTYDFWDEFYLKYKRRLIEFDGNIALMQKNRDFKYTYDVLIEAGDYSETSSVGAPFRALRVVVPFGWKKTNPDDLIDQGTNVHVVARIWDYSEGQSFEIKLESTTVR